MHWVQANSSDFGGTPPQARSGHTTVNIGKSMIIVFGGLFERRFLNDVAVYDTENKIWFNPECTGNESDGLVGPCPRAFHVAVAIDCHMFVFGGRFGNKRLGDFWMLDTDIWQWSELTSYGDLPSPRDFAAAAAIGNRKIVMYGGWDGKKWLSDVYVLDTSMLPPPRCGHTVTMVEKRLLVFGGRGGGGPIMGDLWALKGLFEEENETPGWTQLKLPGQSPSARCGHTITSGRNYLLLFGGHGTGGWLSRYDIYHNDCIVLDRVTVQWKRLPTSNEPPPARAYHSMTCIGSRYLLFGGYDGKSAFGDLWWLVPEDDPIATRLAPSPQNRLPEKKYVVGDSNSLQSITKKESQMVESPIVELQKRLEILVSPVEDLNVVDELNDKEFLELSSRLMTKENGSCHDRVAAIQEAMQAVRNHWKNSASSLIQLRELGPLLRDYQRLIIRSQIRKAQSGSVSSESLVGQQVHRFYHVRSASQLRMDDIPKLLDEYKELLSN